MKVASLFSLVLLFGLLGRALAAPATGSISGTVSLATGSRSGPAFVPEGSVIVVKVGGLSGNPDALHLTTVALVEVSAPAQGKPAAFSMSGLPLGVPLVIQAEAHALNQGPHYWDVGLDRRDAGPNATLTLTAHHPRVTSDAFSAKGATLPPDAGAGGPVARGSVEGVLALAPAGTSSASAFPPGLEVIAYVAADPSATPVGLCTITSLPADDGSSATARFALTGLPLDATLVLHLVRHDGATTNLNFAPGRPGRITPGMRLVDGAWHVTLSAAKRDVTVPTTRLAGGPLASPAASESPSAPASPK